MILLNLLVFLLLFPFCCILFFRKNNPLPNRILAIVLLIPALSFLVNASAISGFIYHIPFAGFLLQSANFLFAPLAYYYIRLLTGSKFQWKNPLHFVSLACILLTLYYGVEFYMMPAAEQRDYLDRLNSHKDYPYQLELTSNLFISLQLVYFSVATWHIYHFRKIAPYASSSYERINAAFVTRFMALLWILTVITVLLYATLPILQVEYLALPIVVALIFYFIIYYSFHYNSIFSPASYQKFLAEIPQAEAAVPIQPKDAPPIDVAELELVMKRTMDHFEVSPDYTDPDLTITTLATRLNIPVRKLSLAINKVRQETFYDLVNDLRIEKAISVLKNQPAFTVEAVAKESGFNSRSAFYRVFKKQTGKTPVEFLENMS